MLGRVTSQAGAGQGEAGSTSVPAVAEERNSLSAMFEAPSWECTTLNGPHTTRNAHMTKARSTLNERRQETLPGADRAFVAHVFDTKAQEMFPPSREIKNSASETTSGYGLGP